MAWPRRPERTPPLPAEVRAALALAKGEKLLSYAGREAGGWAVTTSAALVLLDAADPPSVVARHLWHEVAEATWEPETAAIAIRWAAPSEPGLVVHLDEQPGHVPEVLRERVMSTYVLSQRVLVRGRRGVTVAVRRHAVDGSLFTQSVPDDGVDPARPQTAEQVAALTRDLAEQVGLRV